MTSIFKLSPPKPKLSFVWDVDILFRYLETQGSNNVLSKKLLTQKLLVLLFLLGSGRTSTMKSFRIKEEVSLNDILVTFIPGTVLKHYRPGRSLDKFENGAYIYDRLSIVSCLMEYICRRNILEGMSSGQLIVTLKMSFKGTSTGTIRR